MFGEMCGTSYPIDPWLHVVVVCVHIFAGGGVRRRRWDGCYVAS